MKITVSSTLKYLLWYIIGTFIVIALLIMFPQLITFAGSFM